jgi:hypothetical protein
MAPSEQLADDPEFPAPDGADPVVGPSKPRLLGILGPGLITGASDDDPSGIATYSQAGAQLGFNSLWLMLFSYPLMAVTQRSAPGSAAPRAADSPEICDDIMRRGSLPAASRYC